MMFHVPIFSCRHFFFCDDGGNGSGFELHVGFTLQECIDKAHFDSDPTHFAKLQYSLLLLQLLHFLSFFLLLVLGFFLLLLNTHPYEMYYYALVYCRRVFNTSTYFVYCSYKIYFHSSTRRIVFNTLHSTLHCTIYEYIVVYGSIFCFHYIHGCTTAQYMVVLCTDFL